MNRAVVNGQPVPVDDPDPNTLGTFARHFGQQIDPRPIANLVPLPPSLGGAGWDAPVQAAKHLLQAQTDVGNKMIASYKEGDYVSAAIHALNWLTPVLGPVLDKAGQDLRHGKVASAAGDTLGVATALTGPDALRVASRSEPAQRLATMADAKATNDIARTITPQTGPNKLRFGNMSADVAPRIARETTAKTIGGLTDEIAQKADASLAALDAAYDAVPNTRMYPTAPIVKGLQRAIDDLKVSGIGGKVEPANNAARIATLRQALNEAQGLGSLANIDNLRKLRGTWDQGAKQIFTPAIAPDYLKARGVGSGWADARTVLGDFIGSQHPELKPLNADVHVWLKAQDVLQAAEEAERVRPTVGRSIMARAAGGAVGAPAGGKGIAIGAIVGPLVERTIANVAPARRLMVSRQLASLADALRNNQPTRVATLVRELRAATQISATAAERSVVPAVALPTAATDQSTPAGGR